MSHVHQRRRPVAALPPAGLAWRLRAAALACQGVRAGRSLPEALNAVCRDADPAARGAAQDLSYRTMRWRAVADALLAQMASRLPAPEVRELLVVALAQSLDEPAPYAQHVLVDQAVAAAPSQAQGFVNAVLRRWGREREALLARLDADARWNYPSWWLTAVRDQWPDAWARVLSLSQQPAPMTLRVNRRQATPEQVEQACHEAGFALRRSPPIGGIELPHALILDTPRPVHLLPGFTEGWWSVQDAGAQLAAPLLAVEPGMQVLDACAAPGGKTAHLLELADCHVVALDHDGDRLVRVQQTLDRLGLHAELTVGDAVDPHAWWTGEAFDRILADVPCSASGIVRRHPDIRWLRRESDVAALATTAAGILDALWRLLKPDGTMLLATCSIFGHEGAEQARQFLARHPDAQPLSAPGQLLPTDSDGLTHDGFFYFRVRKQPT